MPYGQIDELVLSYNRWHVTELRVCNENPMTAIVIQMVDIMEVSNNDLQKTYRATEKATECGRYGRIYRQRRNEWLEQTGLRPEMDCGLTGSVAGDAW